MLHSEHLHDVPDGSLNVAQLPITPLSPASHVVSSHINTSAHHKHDVHDTPLLVVKKPVLHNVQLHDVPDGSLNVAQLLITVLSPASHVISPQ